MCKSKKPEKSNENLPSLKKRKQHGCHPKPFTASPGPSTPVSKRQVFYN